MLHIEKEAVRAQIFDGNFGLEKESLRILENGKLSHSPHPFPDDEHIVRDFCENQTEINTSVHTSVKGALDELTFHTKRIQTKLQTLPQREYLWPFSNPPVRCSEMGYWNQFAPLFDYESIASYADSIQKYVDNGLLKTASELYYPIRLKPKGENNLDTLRESGVNHIELRMYDLNPLTEAGVEEKDILFAQLLMIWLVSTPAQPFTEKDQIQAVQNFKNAAHYDLKTVKIVLPNGENRSVAKAALHVIDQMKKFYRSLDLPVQDILDFEQAKFTEAENRYAWKIRARFQDGYVKKALKFVKERLET